MTEIRTLSNALVSSDGIIFDAGLKPIPGFNVEFDRYPDRSSYPKVDAKPVIRLPAGTSFYNLVFPLSNIWGHWTDTLQKLLTLKKSKSPATLLFDRFTYGYPQVSDPMAWLRYMGIANRVYALNDEHKSFRSYNYLASELLYMPPNWKSSAECDHDAIVEIAMIMKENAKTDVMDARFHGERHPKIFVKRSQNNDRSVLNWTELERRLRAGGWFVFNAEHYTLAETMNIFKHARRIAGLHNSGFKNIMFADSPELVEEWYPGNWGCKMKNGKMWHDKSIHMFCKHFCDDCKFIVGQSEKDGSMEVDLK